MTLNFLLEVVASKIRLTFKALNPSGVNYIVIRSSLSSRLLPKTKRESSLSGNWAESNIHDPLMDFPVCKIQQLTEGNKSRNVRKNTGRVARFLAIFSESCFELYSVLSNVDGKQITARIFPRRASVQFKCNSSEII